MEFAANSTSTRLSVALPDGQWDIASLPITVRLLPSNDYVGADIGFFTFVLVRLQDNYTAHELELNFGKDSANDADEGAPLKFIVKSRQQDTDTGQTATFTVRVETSRSGADYRLDGCEEGPKNGPYKNLPLEITGSALEVEGGPGDDRERCAGGELEVLGGDPPAAGPPRQQPLRLRGGPVSDGEAELPEDANSGQRHRGPDRNGHESRPTRPQSSRAERRESSH